MERVSISEAARRLGVTRGAVQGRIRRGTLSALEDGKLDWAVAQHEWTGNRDESKVRRPIEQLWRPDQQPHGDEAVPVSSSGSGNFNAARTAREYVRVEREKLELARMRGELAPIAEINCWVAGMIVRAREILLRIGPELKDRLGQESNPHRCEELLTGEVTRALNELREYRPAVAA